ncbi:MAG: endonuclease/exonuclease/phosphatase family protein, partial [Candidatus Hinthialibacter sp.]
MRHFPMKTLISLKIFGLLFLMASLAASPSPAEEPVRVMTFNIRYNNPGDGVNAWPNRKDHVAEMIQRYDVDLVGLQEVLKEQLDDLVERLPEYGWIGVGRDDGKEAGEYCPIFYRKDRFRPAGNGTFWLSETPDEPGKMGWDAACNRIVTWGRFRERDSGIYLLHYNTHFDHRGGQARQESAKLLWRKISENDQKLLTVVTGDFNARETSLPYKILTGQEPAGETASDLQDARYVSKSEHEGPTSTTTNWVEDRGPESKIDYIFVRNDVEVAKHQVLTDRFDGRFPSDHLPVLIEVDLSNVGIGLRGIAPIPGTVQVEEDVVYGKGGGRDLKMNLFYPKEKGEGRPGIVFVHGGGWISGTRDHFQRQAVYFANQGYVCMCIEYRLSREALFPAAVEDAKCAVRWMRAHAETYGVDPGKIAASGGSAGGHLAAMLGVTKKEDGLEGSGGSDEFSSRPNLVV